MALARAESPYSSSEEAQAYVAGHQTFAVTGNTGGSIFGSIGDALGDVARAVTDNPIMEAVADAAQFVVAPIATVALAPVKAATHLLAETGVDALEDINSAVTDVYRPLAADAVTNWEIGAQVGGAMVTGGMSLTNLAPAALGAIAPLLGGAGGEAPMQGAPQGEPAPFVPLAGAPSWLPLALVTGAVVLLLSILRR